MRLGALTPKRDAGDRSRAARPRLQVTATPKRSGPDAARASLWASITAPLPAERTIEGDVPLDASLGRCGTADHSGPRGAPASGVAATLRLVDERAGARHDGRMRPSLAILASLLATAPGLAYTRADIHTPLSAASGEGFVALHGRIVPGSLPVVRAALDRAGPGRTRILIDSPGGSIAPAMAIGRLIRARGLAVEVARVADGKPTGAAASCASACVLVLAAGTSRLVSPAARVGVHRLVDWTTYSRTWDVYRVLRRRGVEVGRVLLSRRVLSSRDVFTDAPPGDYAAVRRYVAEMGETPRLVALMQGTPSAGLHWMTPEELRATKIATDRAGG